MSRPRHKEKGLGENTPDENTAKGKYQTRQNSICLLTSSLVYQWCVSEEQSGAQRCRGFSCFSFLQRSGGSEAGRGRGHQQIEGEEEEGREQD